MIEEQLDAVAGAKNASKRPRNGFRAHECSTVTS